MNTINDAAFAIEMGNPTPNPAGLSFQTRLVRDQHGNLRSPHYTNSRWLALDLG